jgi:hypothetical protein
MGAVRVAAETVPEVDPQRPSGARVYDYYLGGTHNFAADRQAAAVALAAMPELPAVLRMGRAFLRRAVVVAAESGIDQFLDLGAGIPAPGSVPEVARRIRPAARIVSVDIDPVAVVHTRRVAAGDPGQAELLADLTDADAVLGAEPVRKLIDVDRPVCLLAVAVAHFLPDTERLGRALERYREALAPGSYLVLSHACPDGDRPHAKQILRRAGGGLAADRRGPRAGAERARRAHRGRRGQAMTGESPSSPTYRAHAEGNCQPPSVPERTWP